MSSHSQRSANIWTARIIPLFLIAVAVYSTYVVIAQLCIDYLLRPGVSAPHGNRPGLAIALLVLHVVLLVPMAATYFRLLATVLTNPGLVPRGPQWCEMNAPQASHQLDKTLGLRNKETLPPSPSDAERGLGLNTSAGSEKRPLSPDHESDKGASIPGLESFYSKDVFVCREDGFPIWCSTCLNWKPDRAHHCSEISRCVEKMDHFCPWVGGIVSKTSFKFFLQFVAYTAVYCGFVLCVMAYFISEQKRTAESVNVHWIATLVFAAVFATFTIGMTLSSAQLTLLNLTTVENVTRHSKVTHLAVYIPDPERMNSTFTTSRPPLKMRAFPIQDPNDQLAADAPRRWRTFAILSTHPGQNPWDLGAMANWRSVMGERVIDWFLPIRHSPCANDGRSDSAYAFGRVVHHLRSASGVGLEQADVGHGGSP